MNSLVFSDLMNAFLRQKVTVLAESTNEASDGVDKI